MNLSGGLANMGVLDLSNSSAAINATSSIVDLSHAIISNSRNLSLDLDAHSLLIVPAGLNPANYFTHYNNAGLVHQSGSTLLIRFCC